MLSGEQPSQYVRGKAPILEPNPVREANQESESRARPSRQNGHPYKKRNEITTLSASTVPRSQRCAMSSILYRSRPFGFFLVSVASSSSGLFGLFLRLFFLLF